MWEPSGVVAQEGFKEARGHIQDDEEGFEEPQECVAREAELPAFAIERSQVRPPTLDFGNIILDLAGPGWG